ncbi:probable myosin light chain kinase DDB_G0271550 [Homarus americanus]|uniref:5'-AMP-activated protein kinase catalytic subunit alpha-1-like n=1 Tax=Homarus americanus TaxID=6706 RepID=A0A8J5TC06_HOMAM|nr:probable myosin light chain kinase DDB_G0271550 [Homarus americanus]KAG7173836.1 5'-AMP-activated protein kinase catalytic subunit alpha-1-like [Homarus americanus]
MVLVGHYHMGGVLGRGRFGWVSRATHQVVGYQVAVKHQPWAVDGVGCGGETGQHTGCLHVEETQWRAALENEAALLARISHPSVVALMEVMRGPSGLYVCLEDLGDTTLAALVIQHYEKKCCGLAEPIAAIIFNQVAAGLHHLHNQGILHRDVKPENIMIVPGKELVAPVAKLIDLGLAAAWDSSSPLTTAQTRAGTVSYMAPELTSSAHEYGPEIDVFSLGASLYFTLVGEVPFNEYTRNGRRGTTALFGLQLQHEDALDTLTPQAAAVLRAMLHTNPASRWTLPRVCGHSWFCKQNSISSIFIEYPDSQSGRKGTTDARDGMPDNNKLGKLSSHVKGLENEVSSISCCNLEFNYTKRCELSDESSDAESTGSCNNSVNTNDGRKQSFWINMQCVGHVSSLLQKDSEDVLHHLGHEPWGPVGGVYNLLLRTTPTNGHTCSKSYSI